MMPDNAMQIPKEALASVHFPKEPLSLSAEQRAELLQRIHRAIRLGNARDHVKCRILFEDDQGLKYVETTIWTADHDVVVLKYGMTIPVARIRAIEFP
jgi:hypothetical protein